LFSSPAQFIQILSIRRRIIRVPEVNPFTGSLERYKACLQHTRDFIGWKGQATNIDLLKLNFGFITDYEFWLKSVRGGGL
jgi:hypothetical protein